MPLRYFFYSALLAVFLIVDLLAATPAKDAALLDRVQRETLDYMWEYGHPVSGMARERYTGEDDKHGRARVSTGATGFGIAAIVVGAERGWIPRQEALTRLLKIAGFLHAKTDRKHLHGAFPHWLHGETGRTLRFSPKDNGADLVETAFLMEGLLIARAYFSGDGDEARLRQIITALWEDVEWDFFANGEENGLLWHWSPDYGFEMNLKITGFNECMLTYVLAAASPTHPISRKTYAWWTSHSGYDTRTYNGYTIQGAVPYAGPLFFTHYSFIGLNPYAMADEKVTRGYGIRNTLHTLINRAYCLETAPPENRYSPVYWGLTASDIKGGYTASSPRNDHATVAPTAALSSMPYTPHYSMQVLENLYANYPDFIGPYGPRDALSLKDGWFASGYIGIDQLPITCMIENHRSGLLWRLFMADPDIQRGLQRAGIHPPCFETGFPEAVVTLKAVDDRHEPDALDLRRHPDTGFYSIPYWVETPQEVTFTLSGNRFMQIIPQSADTGRNVLIFGVSSETPPESACRLTLKTARGKEHAIALRLH